MKTQNNSKNPKYEQLCQKDNFTIQVATLPQTTSNPNSLHIKLIHSISKNEQKVYHRQLTSLQGLGYIEQHCQDLGDLKQLLTNPSNILWHSQPQTLSITEQSKFKKDKQVTLANIKLQLIESIRKQTNQNLINAILERSQQKSDLTSDDVKEMFETVALCLGEIVDVGKVTRKELLERIQCNNKGKGDKEVKNMEKKQISNQNTKQMILQTQNIKQQMIKDINLMIQSKIKQINYKFDSQHETLAQAIHQQQLRNTELSNKNNVRTQDLILQIQRQYKQYVKNQNNKVMVTIDRIKDKLIMFSEESQQKFGKLFDFVVENSKINEKSLTKQLQYIDFVDPECYYYKNLIISGNTIINKEAPAGTIILGKQILTGTQPSFTVVFQKISLDTALGIVDTEYKHKQRIGFSDCNTPNYIRYKSFGNFRIGQNSQGQFGTGFEQGQIIKVILDRKLGRIYYKIGQEIRHQYQCELIKDNRIRWVPYIFLKESDVVRVIP